MGWRRETFERDGYLVLEGFVDPEACLELGRRADEIVAERVDELLEPSVFSTLEQERRSDEWFLGSGDTIRCFVEAEATDDEGRLVVAPDRAVNKIGHAQHDLDPTFDRFSRTAELADLADELGFGGHVLWQSMFIFKHPRIGGEVTSHVDHTFLWTEPSSCVGFWFAIDDADEGNGAMWAAPGTHRHTVSRRFRRVSNDPADGTTFDGVTHDTPADDELRCLSVPRGTLIVLDGRLPHLSGANRSDRSRRAYTLHAIDPTAEYPQDNWLQRPDLPARGFRP